jgi:Leucine-rich repeat (LRR) protein
MPKLTYTTPPPSLMIELREVTTDSHMLATELATANQLPSEFPVEQLQEMLVELQSLPDGTAEGCRQPLEYARSRLPAIRRKFIQTEEQSRRPRADEDEPPPLTRGMVIDQRLGALISSVTTALDEYRALASVELDDAADTAPSLKIDTKSPDVVEAMAAAKTAEQRLDEGAAEVTRITEPGSITADNLKRQMHDALSLLRLARIELRMPEFVPRWYQKATEGIKNYPRILKNTAKTIRMGIDVARPLVDAWSHFQHGYKTLILDSLERAAQGLEAVSKKWDTERGAAKDAPSSIEPDNPPPDFDLDIVHEMILAGIAPKPSWRRWISHLDFTSQNLRNLAPLADLRALKTLTLNSTRVTDLGPLANLTALQTLNLNHTEIKDLRPVAGLIALETLVLIRTQVSDLGPLEKLRALQTLVLDGTLATDLTPITRLTGLRRLNLINTRVSDIKAISRLSALQTLYLNRTLVSNLKPLADLTALQTLVLDGAPVTDLEPLERLTGLKRLNLSRTPVIHLNPIAHLTALQTLVFNHTAVNNLEPLANLAALERLSANNTSVVNLAPLARLTTLRNLSLDNTQVSDLAPLAGIVALERLELVHTKVTDLAPLSDLRNLSRVFVEDKKRREALAKTFGIRGIIHVREKG